MAGQTPSSTPTSGLPLAMLLVLGANWGLGFSLNKIGVTGGLSPFAYVFWQCFGAGCILLAIAASRRLLPPLDWRHLRYYVLAGLGNAAIPNLISLTVVQHIPVGVVVLIVTLAPLLTYGLAVTFRLERLEPRRALGVALGFTGTLFILLPRASLPSPDAVPWVLLAMLTPACYGASNIYMAWARPPHVPSLALGASMQLAAGLSFLPLALATGAFYMPWPPFAPAELANLSHVAVAAFGSLVFFEIMRLAGPVFASQVGYIVCLTGVFWGKLFFGERHSLWIWAALVVILAGVALVTWPRRQKEKA